MHSQKIAGEKILEIGDSPHQTVVELDLRLPIQQLLGARDVRATLFGIVPRQRTINDRGLEPVSSMIRRRVPKSESQRDCRYSLARCGRAHQADQAVDKVVDIAEGSGLGAVAIDADRLRPSVPA